MSITKVDILAIGVHPDDVELSCSGTLLKHIDLGKKVGLLDLTLGELGTRGTAVIRAAEAEEATRRMGVSWRRNLDIGDGFFTYNPVSLHVQQIKKRRLHKNHTGSPQEYKNMAE